MSCRPGNQDDFGTTHHEGCWCHEEQHREAIAALTASRDELRARVEVLEGALRLCINNYGHGQPHKNCCGQCDRIFDALADRTDAKEK